MSLVPSLSNFLVAENRLVKAALVLAFVTGCSQVPGQTPPDATVRALSTSYWEAMVAEDYASAYEYLSPGFRARVNKEAYAMRFLPRTKWGDADIRAVNCEDKRCVVELDAKFTFLGDEHFPPHSGKTELTQAWVRDGKNWWMVPKR